MKLNNSRWTMVMVGVIAFLMVGTMVWASPPASGPSAPVTAGLNADTVDGLHASKWPRAYRLLALKKNKKFPASVIPGAITRDQEVMTIVKNKDGAGSGLNADLLDGQEGAYYLTLGGLSCLNGQVAKWNETTSQWECGNDEISADGVGDITAVYAGTGLTGGGQTGPVTLAITDTYQLPQTCSNGQVAKWNSSTSRWDCGDDETGAGGDFWSLTGNAGTTGSNFLGTTDDQALELRVNSARALRLEPSASSPNLIGGYNGNWVTDGVEGASIGGGGSSGMANRVTDHQGTVAGGRDNQAGDDAGTIVDAYGATVGGGESNTGSGGASTVSGGYGNTASAGAATIGGGYGNEATAEFATIAGGGRSDGMDPATGNRVSDQYGTVGGGGDNQAGNANADLTDAIYATVGGGWSNSASGYVATVGGGNSNTASDYFATVAGGTWNTASGDEATVGGGALNTASGARATVSGGRGNEATADYATIAGGGRSDPGDPATANRVTDDYGTVGGGGNNQAGNANADLTDATYATVGGGYNNTASGIATVGGGQGNIASGDYATVGGGWSNTASGNDATVGGGGNNTASAGYATVGGGWSNMAGTSYATVGGGVGNTASGDEATVGGGESNAASSDYATVGGGVINTASGDRSTVGGGVDNDASGYGATVGGGGANTASNWYATIPGGYGNTAQGYYSFAAGRQAKANHQGAFVWADSTDADFASERNDQFRVRANGGARFDVNNGRWVNIYDDGTDLMTTSTGAHLTTGGVWTNSSDRGLKENFTPVDGQEVLELLSQLPITEWNHIAQDPSIRHMGPMAQDFYAAFGLGEDDRHIASLDTSGVALAAIQGLYQMVQEKDAQIVAQQQQIDDLEARVAALEAGAVGPVEAGFFPGAWSGLNILLAGMGLGWLARRGKGSGP